MKLTTSDLDTYVKERHRRQIQSLAIKPILAVAMAGADAASASFVRAKEHYGDDIGVTLQIKSTQKPVELMKQIETWNQQKDISGIIIQLPLPSAFDTEAAIKLIAAAKDVDGLKADSPFDSPAAKGIMWLLGSLPISIKSAYVAVVGQGRLVGAPISTMLESSGAKVERLDDATKNLAAKTRACDIIISATGQPGLINRSMLKSGVIVIDAGTAEASGSITGDADPALYDDPDIQVTPVPGGVGPLTVAALFDNLLIASQL
ncbi:MAG TPA: bifunctional 5,10-methylenetetrahydrofolate dehydrogenase/5,10-methenyltetrahydrofolate cyclohydrolase [Candidatus Saccharimonadales bacterium]|nr:bifunctional 5,10-methylenetetrahydrofolate dehydrogenase/5,10-methenyltetrahydrofolate cyclohydrolase [Candidatus Saccharimonadales bacterium]